MESENTQKFVKISLKIIELFYACVMFIKILNQLIVRKKKTLF